MRLSTRQVSVNCKHRLAAGQTKADVCEFLVKEGMQRSEAEELVSTVLDGLRQQAIKMAFGGIGVMLATSVIAYYLLFAFFGVALLGVVLGVIGLKQWLKLRSQ